MREKMSGGDGMKSSCISTLSTQTLPANCENFNNASQYTLLRSVQDTLFGKTYKAVRDDGVTVAVKVSDSSKKDFIRSRESPDEEVLVPFKDILSMRKIFY